MTSAFQPAEPANQLAPYNFNTASTSLQTNTFVETPTQPFGMSVGGPTPLMIANAPAQPNNNPFGQNTFGAGGSFGATSAFPSSAQPMYAGASPSSAFPSSDPFGIRQQSPPLAYNHGGNAFGADAFAPSYGQATPSYGQSTAPTVSSMSTFSTPYTSNALVPAPANPFGGMSSMNSSFPHSMSTPNLALVPTSTVTTGTLIDLDPLRPSSQFPPQQNKNPFAPAANDPMAGWRF
jgi:hypothetical protein